MAWGAVLFALKHSPVWVFPLITARVVDIAAHPDRHPISELWINAGLLATLVLANVPINAWVVSTLHRSSRSVELRLRSALCRRLQQLSIGYYTRQSAGVLQAKVLRDVEAVEGFTRALYDTGLSAVINLTSALVITAWRAPGFLWAFAISVPWAVILIRLLNRHVAPRQQALREEIEQMSARVVEMTHLIPITRAHGLESTALEKVDDSLRRVEHAGLSLDRINATFGALSWVAFNVFNLAVLIFAVWASVTGFLAVSVGDVVMLTGYFGLLTGSVLALAGSTPLALRGFEALRSIGEVLESPDVEHNEGKRPVTHLQGTFRFEQVGFRYPEANAPALAEISLSVSAGETIALVGPSGAGKSTLVNLVIGFLRPTSGRLLLDGRPVDELDLRTYRRFLSVVPQETLLFDGTVRENVTYGLADVSTDRVERALHDANAWDFVQQLPDGWETRLGERGARLSGGQKQRLAIARALIRDARVLILDEATSALDTESEAQIQQALERLMRNRTTFVVAHRMSTIRHAHRIVVMEAGRIAEIGDHDTLLAAGGLYARLQRTALTDEAGSSAPRA